MINEPDIIDVYGRHVLGEILMVGGKTFHQFPEIACPFA